jgi:hypothetical protein
MEVTCSSETMVDLQRIDILTTTAVKTSDPRKVKVVSEVRYAPRHEEVRRDVRVSASILNNSNLGPEIHWTGG